MITSPRFNVHQVSAMVDAGYLSELVADFAALREYWKRFLMDFPDHPVANSPAQDTNWASPYTVSWAPSSC